VKPSGEKYEGYWENDKHNGKGSLCMEEKDSYTGDWIEDKKDGLGKYVWRDGDVYDG
jgi:hypothetical protein